MPTEEQQKLLRAQVPKGTAGAAELERQGFTDVGIQSPEQQDLALDKAGFGGSPNAPGATFNPATQKYEGGLSKVPTQGVGPDGKPVFDVFAGQEHIANPSDPRLKGVDIAGLPEGQSPTGFKSKFAQGFDQAKAAGEPETISNTSQARALTNQYAAPSAPNPSDAFLQGDEFFTGLVKTFQDFIKPENQRTSLTETYKQMTKDSGVEALDTELLNMKNVIEGSEEDLRTEITKAGGFATESQVQALTNSRNKQLIKNYNNLLETRNSKEKYLNTLIGLESQDRESADKRFEQAFNMGSQIADLGIKMKANAVASLDRVKGAIGWAGILQATQNDPYTMSLIEKTYGLPQGGLALAAQEEARLKTQATLKTSLETKKTQAEIDKINAEVGKAPLELEKTRAEIAKIKAETTKLKSEGEKKTGIETITPYQHEQAVRVVNSVSNLKNKVSDSVVGTLRAKVSRFMPGTDAANFKAEVEQLKTQIFTRELAAMRDASKTGGAVGNVSDTEGEKLSNTLGALDLNQSPAQFKKNLIEVENSLNRWYSALAGENVILAPDGTLKKITD